MHVVIFEGSKWHTFAPLSLSRPVFALASGASSLLEKQVRHLRPTRLSVWVRPALAAWCERELPARLKMPVAVNQPLDDETALLVSGRTLHFSRFEHTEDPCVILEEGNLVRKAVVRSPGLSYDDAMNRTDRWLKLFDLPKMNEQARMADYVWDLISWNEESLVEDFVALHEQPSQKPVGPYHMVHDENVWIGPDVKLEPGVVLDAVLPGVDDALDDVSVDGVVLPAVADDDEVPVAGAAVGASAGFTALDDEDDEGGVVVEVSVLEQPTTPTPTARRAARRYDGFIFRVPSFGG